MKGSHPTAPRRRISKCRRQKRLQKAPWTCYTAQWYLPSLEFTSPEERPRKARKRSPPPEPAPQTPAPPARETPAEGREVPGVKRGGKSHGQEGNVPLEFTDASVPLDASNSEGRKATARSSPRARRQR